jgi:hypothetical protein
MLAGEKHNYGDVLKLIGIHSKYQALVTALRQSDRSKDGGTEDEDWHLIFTSMFQGGDAELIRQTCREIGVSIDWYVPDTSYEDDVMAPINALKELVDRTMVTDPEIDWMAMSWFKRHADSRNLKAFIRTDPEYFAMECASAILNGGLIVKDEKKE